MRTRLRLRRPCGKDRAGFGGRTPPASVRLKCCRSSVVEHPLGKGEVVSSILTGSTRKRSQILLDIFRREASPNKGLLNRVDDARRCAPSIFQRLSPFALHPVVRKAPPLVRDL